MKGVLDGNRVIYMCILHGAMTSTQPEGCELVAPTSEDFNFLFLPPLGQVADNVRVTGQAHARFFIAGPQVRPVASNYINKSIPCDIAVSVSSFMFTCDDNDRPSIPYTPLDVTAAKHTQEVPAP